MNWISTAGINLIFVAILYGTPLLGGYWMFIKLKKKHQDPCTLKTPAKVYLYAVLTGIGIYLVMAVLVSLCTALLLTEL